MREGECDIRENLLQRSPTEILNQLPGGRLKGYRKRRKRNTGGKG
jgi:hypothetical protein